MLIQYFQKHKKCFGKKKKKQGLTLSHKSSTGYAAYCSHINSNINIGWGTRLKALVRTWNYCKSANSSWNNKKNCKQILFQMYTGHGFITPWYSVHHFIFNWILGGCPDMVLINHFYLSQTCSFSKRNRTFFTQLSANSNPGNKYTRLHGPYPLWHPWPPFSWSRSTPHGNSMSSWNYSCTT